MKCDQLGEFNFKVSDALITSYVTPKRAPFILKLLFVMLGRIFVETKRRFRAYIYLQLSDEEIV